MQAWGKGRRAACFFTQANAAPGKVQGQENALQGVALQVQPENLDIPSRAGV
jgi:hypothetical protein